ncbi:WD repeat-containing protein 44 [Cynara cardunculus var. scolymus]|uniref:G-protein beta WD-40 repeat-containing protein n=1 Tax=Cynara cardunculus var. scolymus TaxID=59895 RepID=A0A103YJE5_CYNCS|nr:WD repeat-containing protein 44 [Cynara cardunculus var. scolymus]XP_024986167.1 WD repeat-containing protein 44 [Cynara cardunculus var. scolymus]XP_024986174.1 WD repeat-containing protein 44 [Cynara cardunculus var. scolymus]KVI10221.1 G-protein beta WD-40 repeat-containing protein [Cynara cardunculus var. scolymus]
MVSLSQDEEYRFFDAQDSIASTATDSVSKFHQTPVCKHGFNGFQYDFWVKTPASVQDRKNQFLKFMSLSSDDEITADDSGDDDDVLKARFSNRIMENSDAVLRSPMYEEMSSSTSSVSSLCQDASDSSRMMVSKENFICRANNNSNGSTGCREEEEEAGGNSLIRIDNVSSPLVQKLVERQIKVAGTMARTMNRVKSQWLSRLRSMTCVVDRQGRCDGLSPDGAGQVHRTRVQRVRVRQSKKRLKELSAVFTGQDIQAHQGSILTMKFGRDGRYLASAGEDGVVRVWQVVEDDRSNDIDIPDIDPSCIYFTVNQLSELAPIMAEKQKMSMLKSLRKTSDSACVIVPPKVFRILEKPVHEFHGHNGEILDLSWSNDNRLLSSSVDETVRLWRVGSDRCLKVFPHSNYVTCVQFNPVDESYFISGSIDGKVRIWSIGSSQVVDWTDIRDIITAVTYNPDGKGGIIGSMTGCCRFFCLSDNHFQLEASVCLNSKKKSPCKRIIGFQFCPQDPSKVMVTCADSHIRILHGINVIGKYKGQRNAGNQFCASFTSDGKHIVSACEDSNVYIWNCRNQKEPSVYQQKTVRSFECFSSDASVVLPWSGLKVSTSSGNGWNLEEGLPNSLPFSSPSYFSLGQEFFLESIPKGSATWPEEKLPTSSPPPPGVSSPLCKSEYKFFKSSCQSSASSHAWGLVIVTAGWDGHIRSFLNYGLPVTL